ncbi:MAG: amidophosphoribosyltransferase [Betaproteobacteria bacterium]|nr:amidophosphoribosyltransferase [Betaproteobacteria bacterium]
MCGIVGVRSHAPVNQTLYDALLLLQHRGQDAAGIATESGRKFYMHKANGLVRDVFRTRNMRALPGDSGIGQVRYPTAGNASSEEEAQPFYVNAPFGIVFAHNGNLTNDAELRAGLFGLDRRHINTESDSETLLNVLAHELQQANTGRWLDPDAIFRAVAELHRKVRGAYAVVADIAGYGLLAFRDPYGIRPLCYGVMDTAQGPEYMVASESVALEGLGYRFVRDVKAGEAIFVDTTGALHARQCADRPQLTPCLFEYVYFARPDSVMDGINVYAARLNMGEELAAKVAREFRSGDIDVVMPIPDSARPSAMQMAMKLNLPYREGFVKNRYVGRTFIMPGQAVRKKSIHQKLNTMPQEFKGKSVLLVDDSIVRGNTSGEIIQMAREAGARKVIFASASPPVRYPNVYGIDMPTRSELVANGRSEDEIRQIIRADALVYQDIDALRRAVGSLNPAIRQFEGSCFDGHYVTGDVTPAYLDALEAARKVPRPTAGGDDVERSPLSLKAANLD